MTKGKFQPGGIVEGAETADDALWKIEPNGEILISKEDLKKIKAYRSENTEPDTWDVKEKGLHIEEDKKRKFEPLHIDRWISKLKKHDENCDCKKKDEK